MPKKYVVDSAIQLLKKSISQPIDRPIVLTETNRQPIKLFLRISYH